jgi:predicted membrane protein
MKQKFIILAGLVFAGTVLAKAQEYKLAKSSGKLEIKEVNNVSIEGYNGNEIVFSSRDHDRDKDDRAKGLRAISSMGLEDNTGIGLSVVDKGNVIEVQQLKKMDGPDIKILVPKGVAVSYSHTSPHGSDVGIKNVESEIEVSTVHNGVYLDNVTGPMTIKTVHGEIEASFGATMKNPISITSVHGHVDVSLPVTTKANLRLGTAFGEIFVDPDFKIEIERSGNMIKYSDNVTGKINGGGLDITLSSTHDNVYLRKK